MPVTSSADLLALLEKFPWKEWNRRLAPGLTAVCRDILLRQGARAAALAGGQWDPADPFLDKFLTTYVGERIVQLDRTTRRELRERLRDVFATGGGKSAAELRDQVLDEVRQRYEGYEEWRALRIARTESAIAYNHGDIFGFAQAQVERVTVIDGTGDAVCAEANGRDWTLAEALDDPVAHPNCVRSFAPVVSDKPAARRSASERHLRDLDPAALATRCAARSDVLVDLDDPTPELRDPTDDDLDDGTLLGALLDELLRVATGGTP